MSYDAKKLIKILKDQCRDAKKCGTDLSLLRQTAGFTIVTGTCEHYFHEDCFLATKDSKCPTCSTTFKVQTRESFLTFGKKKNVWRPEMSAPTKQITHLSEMTQKINLMDLGKMGQMLTQMMSSMSGPESWDKLRPGENDALIELPSWSAEYKEALRLFTKTTTKHTMVKIQRIQNSYLYQK